MVSLRLSLSLIGIAALTTSCHDTSPRSARGGNCQVDLWSLPWDQSYQAELDEDGLLATGAARHYRVRGCEYAGQVREFMNHAPRLAPGALPPGGDMRLLARVTQGASSWLLAIPVTCRWLRIDRSNSYQLDPGLIRLLARSLADDDVARIKSFGSCDLG